MLRWLLVVLNLASAAGAARAETNQPALEITADTTLDPGKTYGAIVIKASNVTIDGQGAWLIGATEGDPKTYKGVGISAAGVSDVILKGLRVKGWETGLLVKEASGWRIENCDFSDNFHDPKFGWGENGRRGGIVLEKVSNFRLLKNQVHRVWDACVLVDSDDNVLEENDFSHTSNTCLKLWHSSRNAITKNNLSYGLRKDPGEVHARDSTSVLIESGSNGNRFIENDCTHGGDGIFIRVLNQWVSTGNVFEKNDCSYANNNCFEAWSPRNTYIGNKANHGSYGFWLGASDKTVLIDNEASYNGLADGFHNSPHLPNAGHAGIVFMFGPSSHTYLSGNECVGNNGAGIALIGHQESQGEKFKAFHWIIQENTLEDNRWGIYAQHADWIDLGANTYRDNSIAAFHNAGNVTNVFENFRSSANVRPPRILKLAGPESARVGKPVAFWLTAFDSEREVKYRWDLGDGTIVTDQSVSGHVFKRPGFYRVGVTVSNGILSSLTWKDLYVVGDSTELGTEGNVADWGWVDPMSKVKFSDDRETKIAGKSSLFADVSPYGGFRLNLLYPLSKRAGWSLADKTRLVFWFKAINENLPAWQDANPIITLHESDDKFVRLTPKTDLLSSPPYLEAREGWSYFEVPLAGNAEWKREGGEITTVNFLTIGFDSWGQPPLKIWLDGLALE